MKQNTLTMTDGQLEKLQPHTYVEENQNNSKSSGKIIENTKVPGTPFTLVDVEDQGTFIAIGNNRVTEMMTREEAEDQIINRDWQLIISLISVVTEAIQKETETK